MDLANREMYNLLLSECKPMQGERILEAGFGGGRHIKRIIGLADGLHYTGIDISGSMVRYAIRTNRNLIRDGIIDIMEADIGNIPFADNSFDMILTVNTIYFWDNPRAVISELSRVLKPGGNLTIGANSRDEMIKQGYPAEHFSFWDLEDIEKLVSDTGMEIRRSFKTDMRIEDCIGVIASK